MLFPFPAPFSSPSTYLLLFFLVPSPVPGVVARGFSHQPEDIHAWPKYKVSFLNGLPVLNHTAQHWLQDGLRGGEKEFLGLEWPTDSQSAPSNLKSIDAGDNQLPMGTTPLADVNPANPSATPSPKLQHMRLDPSNEFLCLILPPPEIPPYTDDTLQPPVPTRTWELLQPLQDTCLYHRQGWFTYAYCHNQYVRQFREKEPQLPLGIKEPQEDPNEDSYTLGHAPTTPVHPLDDAEAHVAVPNRAALANRLELARGAGHRYLIQRWGEGTVCDKTGKKREIEVQFHCSMTSTDSVFFIKETRTCQYTLVIHTPRLCGEPGFKSPRDDLEDTPIRCRKIVDSPAAIEAADRSLPEAPYPWQRPKLTKPLPSPSPPPPPPPAAAAAAAAGGNAGPQDARQKLIKLAIEALLNRQEGENANVQEGFGDLGVGTFEIDEQGHWREEKAKDANEPSDSDPAPAPAAGGRGRDNEGSKDASGGNMRARQQQQHKTTRDKDASSLSSSSQDGTTTTTTTTDTSRVAHRHHDNVGGGGGGGGDGDRPVNGFEIEIGEGEDAKGLADILRAAGYDVEIAELGDDGKYTIQNFDGDGYAAEPETNGDKAGKKRKHRGNEQQQQQQQQPAGGHDEL